MPAGRYDIKFAQGDLFERVFDYSYQPPTTPGQPAPAAQPINLHGYRVKAEFKTNKSDPEPNLSLSTDVGGGLLLVDPDSLVENDTAGGIFMQILPLQTEDLDGLSLAGYWSLKVEYIANPQIAFTIVYGEYLFYTEVTE
jgi:hypothetical protein